MKKFLKSSLASALGTTIYIIVVALIMTNGDKIFGEMKNLLGPIAFLLLFVLSAAITGALMLGQPILIYLDGKKAEAIKHFDMTLLWLLVCFLIVFFANLFLK